MDREWESDSVNRFELGMEIYARLQHELEDSQTPSAETSVEAAPSAGELSSLRPALPLQETENTLWVETPALRNLLEGLSPLPAGNILIGATDDELPLLYNLTQPDPGSLLITGGPKSGKTRLMRAIPALTHSRASSVAGRPRAVATARRSPAKGSGRGRWKLTMSR